MAARSFDALVEMLRVLQSLEIAYLLVGSFSSNAYSYPRATKDADIEIQYSPGDLGRIEAQLSNEYSLNPQTNFEAITGTIRNVVTHLPTKFDIDLFRLGDDAHHQERFVRRRKSLIPSLGIEAVIPTPEDVIIQKIRWQREIDISDARKVLQVQFQKLDWDYLRRWTDSHGTTSLLQRLRAEAQPFT